MSTKPLKPEAIVEFWHAESKLLWSRLQTTAVLEAGVIIGWYKLCEINKLFLAWLLLFVGILLLIIIGLIMVRDAQYMKACENKLGNKFPKPKNLP